MKNYIGKGDSIYIIAPFNVVSGQPLKVGNIFGFIGAPANAGDKVALHVVGEYSVTKVTAQAWGVGDVVYFDNDLKNFANTNVSGSIKAGVATEVALNPSTTGKIRLNGAF
jgi:predicted RecA/RadA family phage recombinase